jgi:drug/metabolite transporter (DMT)-like permease
VITILTVGILAVSMSAIFIRFARESSGSTNAAFGLLIAAGRIALASLVTAPLGFVALSRHQQQTPRGIGKAVWLAVAAGVGLAAHFAFWISSLSFTSVASSTAIVTTNPIWLSLFAWIVWKQVPSRAVMIGIAVSFVGGLLVALGDSAGSSSDAFLNPMLGNALALLGAFAVSAYYLLGRAAQQGGLSLPAYTGVAYTTAALVLAPLPLLFGVPYTGYPISAYLWIALLGLVPQVIGHTSFNWAVKFMNPAIVTMVILLEPIGSSLAAVILFREIPGPLTILGALLLLLGVFIAVRPMPTSRPEAV